MNKKKILLVSSAGGHYSELKKIEKREEYDYVVVTEKDSVNMNDSQVNYFLPYGTRRNKMKYFFVFSTTFFKALYILVKERPNILISTGAHSAVPFFWIGKIFGVKTVYIESYAKVYGYSLTYKLIKKFTDLVIVQHEEMLEYYSESVYYGGIY